MKLQSKYEVQAAHRLSAGVPEDHPCRRLHGHRYNIMVEIDGDVDPETGMVVEYEYLDKMVNGVLAFIDHRFINHLGYAVDERCAPLELLPGFTDSARAMAVRRNSTVEHLALWLKMELGREVGKLPNSAIVSMVEIEEDGGHKVIV